MKLIKMSSCCSRKRGETWREHTQAGHSHAATGAGRDGRDVAAGAGGQPPLEARDARKDSPLKSSEVACPADTSILLTLLSVIPSYLLIRARDQDECSSYRASSVPTILGGSACAHP